ncbi:MarR family transcriptional regulator [Paenibacillus athensensis]|uniref:MarR family transcriptional regulator n=1 Tax=Paenibacillus athensensis TaxID=1967502 RepID=A0A4Y8PWB1_9BACL|nr:MarR family transcriptional regulator [Paenibacillus athensensis]MCD1260609.1 MarR family transcriptional regulator [Paenibacillus athensensis]
MEHDFLKQLINRYEMAMFTVNRRANAMIRDMMPDNLTSDQLATLRYIRQRGKCTSTELADIFCVGKSSITAIITRLHDKELIVRQPDDRDRRVIYVMLTAEGERYADEMQTQIETLMSRYLHQFSEEEALRFMETFEKLAKLLVESEEEKGNVI